MTKRSDQLTEHQVQTQILEELLSRGIFCFRNNSGAFATQYKDKNYFIQFGLKGSSDIIAIINGIFVGIEVKGPRGKQSEYQNAFQKNIEDAGGIYILAFSWEDVVKKINNDQRTTKRLGENSLRK